MSRSLIVDDLWAGQVEAGPGLLLLGESVEVDADFDSVAFYDDS